MFRKEEPIVTIIRFVRGKNLLDCLAVIRRKKIETRERPEKKLFQSPSQDEKGRRVSEMISYIQVFQTSRRAI